jgi:hypothetical protein
MSWLSSPSIESTPEQLLLVSPPEDIIDTAPDDSELITFSDTQAKQATRVAAEIGVLLGETTLRPVLLRAQYVDACSLMAAHITAVNEDVYVPPIAFPKFLDPKENLAKGKSHPQELKRFLADNIWIKSDSLPICVTTTEIVTRFFGDQTPILGDPSDAPYAQVYLLETEHFTSLEEIPAQYQA